MKWKVQRGCRASRGVPSNVGRRSCRGWRGSACRPASCARLHWRSRMNSWCRCRAMHWSMTLPRRADTRGNSALPGSAAGCTSCATRSPRPARMAGAWCRRSSPPPSPSVMPTPSRPSGARLPTRSHPTPKLGRAARRGRGGRARLYGFPHGASGQDPLEPTLWSASAARLSGAPRWSASSPTKQPSTAWSAPYYRSRTTNGRCSAPAT